MPNIIKPKRSNTAAKVPTTTELISGELGVNMADRKVYINNGTAVVQVGAGNLSGLGDVAIATPTNGQALTYNSTTSKWQNSSAGTGTVTSVGITPGTGVTVSGSPVTTSGNIAVGLSTKLTAIENLSGAGFITQNGTGVIAGRTLQAGTGISIAHGNGSSQDPIITNSAPDQTVALTGAGATSISGTYPNFTITSVNTTYSTATSTVPGLIELASDTAQTVAANAVTTTASRTYGLQLNAAGQAVVNVPWTDTVYSLPAATSTVRGGIELGSDTAQTVEPNAVTATASRSYALQVNAAGQGVVNVPWTDTNSGGTVTSVGGTGTVSGLTLTGTVTTSGNLTLGGTLAVTPSNFSSQTAKTFLAAPNAAAGVPTFRAIVASDIPTLNQSTTGNAATATTLQTARTIQTNLASTTSASFNGSANITPGVTGTLPIANGGTGATTAGGALTSLGAFPTSGGSVTGKTELATSSGQVNIGWSGSSDAKLDVRNGANTVANFIGQGSTGNPFVGLGVQSNYASGSAYSGVFYDVKNENGIVVANALVDVNTNGSAAWGWDVTPSGARTSDRRRRAMNLIPGATSGILQLWGSDGASDTGSRIEFIAQADGSTQESFFSIRHRSSAVNGNWFGGFLYNNNVIGSITQNGTTGVSYNTSSDYRLKNIDGPIKDSGNYIDALKPVEGTWKSDGSIFIGFLAHEAQEVSKTNVATGEKDGEQMQSMDYGNAEFIANIVAELQSLRKRVAQLEEKQVDV